jgi:hypothetical protein
MARAVASTRKYRNPSEFKVSEPALNGPEHWIGQRFREFEDVARFELRSDLFGRCVGIQVRDEKTQNEKLPMRSGGGAGIDVDESGIERWREQTPCLRGVPESTWGSNSGDGESQCDRRGGYQTGDRMLDFLVRAIPPSNDALSGVTPPGQL